MRNPFRYFNSSPEIIRLTVMMYARYPLSLRQVEDLLSERGIDICHETVRFWWNRFGPLFAAKIRKRRVHSRSYSQWRWHCRRKLLRRFGRRYFGRIGKIVSALDNRLCLSDSEDSRLVTLDDMPLEDDLRPLVAYLRRRDHVIPADDFDALAYDKETPFIP